MDRAVANTFIDICHHGLKQGLRPFQRLCFRSERLGSSSGSAQPLIMRNLLHKSGNGLDTNGRQTGCQQITRRHNGSLV